MTFDVLHRNEVTGALSGLTRVRQFQQDDCHCFIPEEQIASEVAFLMRYILDFYAAFGLSATIKFATRPEVRIGDDDLWDRAEGGLLAALEETGRPYELNEGDGAFYGPKIDFEITDSIGRAWQCGTIQLDYVAPERFSLEYVGQDNRMHRPVVIHRAVSGSLERFIAILVEHFAGDFPLWLAPEQVRVIAIGAHGIDAAVAVRDRMAEVGLRAHLNPRAAETDFREEIKDASNLKVPYMAIIGSREAEAGDGVATRPWHEEEAGDAAAGRGGRSAQARIGDAGAVGRGRNDGAVHRAAIRKLLNLDRLGTRQRVRHCEGHHGVERPGIRDEVPRLRIE